MDILFENDDFIAVNKTLFIRVQSDASGRDSLEGRLAAFLAARAGDGFPGTESGRGGPSGGGPSGGGPSGGGPSGEEHDRGAGAGAASPGAPLPAARTPFVGLLHRVDQPVTGAVLFAKNPRSLARGSALLQSGEIRRIYWAVTTAAPSDGEGTLEHHLTFNHRRNKVHVHENPRRGARTASLRYRLLGGSQRYFFLEIELLTGRHHQIRAQLAAMGWHIKGDLKYGARRSNPGGGIHLHARELAFTDPKNGNEIRAVARPPEDLLWSLFPHGPGPGGDSRDS